MCALDADVPNIDVVLQARACLFDPCGPLAYFSQNDLDSARLGVTLIRLDQARIVGA